MRYQEDTELGRGWFVLEGEMMSEQTILSPEIIVEEFRRNGVTHVVLLPDSETNSMYRILESDQNLDLVPVTREAETVAIAAGLFIGGKKPVVLIQNTGLFESGDSIRGLARDAQIPMVMLVGYRGWTRHGKTPDSAARNTEPTLRAWGVPYYLVENNADAGRISLAFEDAERTNQPVAVLIGDEYHGFNR
jgi:sulfopyruvate decarboxylase TPP-binding subunit